MKILPIIYGVILIVSIITIVLASSSDFVYAHQVLSGLSSSSSKFQLDSSYSSLTVNDQDAPCKGTAECIVSRVKKIIDGDTIQISKYTIRLSLTNTPEKNQKGYSEATAFTEKLCPIGSKITVDQDDDQKFDKYKRLLGKVYCGGKVLNAELLYNGNANILTQYCKKSEFAKEEWAQKYGCLSKSASSSNTPVPVKPTPKVNTCDPSYPDFCIPPPPPNLNYKDVLPDWIRNNAQWWSLTQISDQDFAKGLEYLIKEDIINVPKGTASEGQAEPQIPSWLRKNAGWWSQGLLTDDEFLKSIQWMINNEFIKI